jgi:hypothetical protein
LSFEVSLRAGPVEGSATARLVSRMADVLLVRQARLESGHPVVVDVLRRYPVAPRGRGRVGELIRQLDASLR